ncbi:hypothetical protein [Leeuwenhoekiella nanhaiensis]|uniref:DNA-binding protein n=1 Tax=Leeuwenhoekiella nanhaiensis TaxID=1655491 RepID=A0A2G1VQ20_9FLAO|nr:hypothetical protein [Leeuwenhoekiella nanhaiensis]PHQ28867.1 hypothetical protein CJ305_11765 [Leeuwenhoekiella nanhaiensis]
MKKYIAIILLLTSFKGIACTCAIKKLSELQKSEIENSECIFIGEVIEVNESDLTYKVKVTESLDGGDKVGTVYTGKNWKYCSPYISELGKWIIYGHMEGGFLRLNMCGISRSFENPIMNPIPLPSPELFEKNITEKERKKIFDKMQAENMKNALSDLELELKVLRKRRNEE